jgi:YD repeat-containing protein
VELYNGAGTLLTTTSEINQSLSAGAYTLLVRDANNTYGGSYQLTWKTLLKPCSGDATPLGCGQVASASVEGVEEIDIYTFEVSANDVVTLRTRKTSGNLSPYMEVYGPGGAIVWQGYTQMNRALTQGGTYTVVLRDDGNVKTGSYLLYWEKLNSPCNVVGEITCGQLVNGTVGTTGESPPWRVHRMSLSTTESVRIRVSNPSGGNFYPYVELYNGAGTLLTTTSEINQSLSAGAYTLLVRDAYNTYGGSYHLKYQKSDNSCPEVIVTAPNGGDILEGGSSFTITWTPTSPLGITSQEIRLSIDRGKSFPNLIAEGLPGNIQFYDWIIPTDISTGKARIQVRVTDVSGMSTPDESDNDFVIVQTVKRTYVYDELNRIIKITYEDGKTVTYTYDAVGNRLTLTEE